MCWENHRLVCFLFTEDTISMYPLRGGILVSLLAWRCLGLIFWPLNDGYNFPLPEELVGWGSVSHFFPIGCDHNHYTWQCLAQWLQAGWGPDRLDSPSWHPQRVHTSTASGYLLLETEQNTLDVCPSTRYHNSTLCNASCCGEHESFQAAKSKPIEMPRPGLEPTTLCTRDKRATIAPRIPLHIS